MTTTDTPSLDQFAEGWDLAIASWATAAAVAELADQGQLQPGDEGWWKAWGVNPSLIRPGDLVATADEIMLVDRTYRAASPMRIGLVIGGKRSTLGALCPVVIYRRDTRNRLADAR